jgi:AcrR family transcriptional regulator
MAAPVQPRWRRLPEERPAQILDAALDVFAAHGLGAARLEDIAKRAGLSKGTIYLYFPNKEALFREVIRQTVVSQIESGERDFELATTSATASLERHMRRHWQFIRSPKFAPIFRLIHAELSQHPDLARFYADEVVTRGHRLLAAIIRRGIDQGEFRDVDPLVAARMLSAPFVMHGIWCRHRDAFTWMAKKSDDEVLAELMDYHLTALCNPPAPKRRKRTARSR